MSGQSGVSRSLLVGLIALLWFAGLKPKRPSEGSSSDMRATAISLIRDRTRDLTRSLTVGQTTETQVTDDESRVLKNGRVFARQPIGAAIACLPAAFLTVHASSSLDYFVLESALVGAILCALFFAFSRRWGDGVALAATALLALSTGLLIAARGGDGTLVSALLLFVVAKGLVSASGPSSSPAALPVVLSAGALLVVDPSYTVSVTWLVALFIVRSRMSTLRAAVTACLLLSFAAVGLWHVRSAGLVHPGGGDFLQGIDGLLLSTGKSLFLYSPPLLLAPFAFRWFASVDRLSALAISIAVALGLFAIALQPNWHGDPAFGPVRAVPLIPLMLLPIAGWLSETGARLRFRFATALATTGLAVQLLGAAFPAGQFLQLVTVVRTQTGAPSWFHDPASECHFVPQFSPLLGHAWMALGTLRPRFHLSAHPPWKLLVPETPNLDAEQKLLRFDFALAEQSWTTGLVWAATLCGLGWLLVRSIRTNRIVD